MGVSPSLHRFAAALRATERTLAGVRGRAPGRLKWSSVAIALIVPLSGLGAFSVTRARFAPTPDSQPAGATLTVQTEPSGAQLLVDGRPRGVTPLTVDVDAGPHTFSVRRAGMERTVTFTATAGAQLTNVVELPLPAAAAPPNIGRLSVVTDPPGARVAIDGEVRGLSPLVISELTAVQHRVVVSGPDGSTERQVTIDPGVMKEVVFSLPRSTAAMGGWLSVATPFPVDLVERGEVVGTSGAAKVMLPAGRHDLVVRNGDLGYESTRKVEVTPGKVTTLQVVAPTGPLSVNARPWAEVLLDGVSLGETPIANLAVTVGRHEITFRHPDFGERRETIVVKATGPNRAAVDLTK